MAKRILLAGRIYTHSLGDKTSVSNNHADAEVYEASRDNRHKTPDTKSSTPPQRMTSNTTSAENYNRACRMLLRANTRKYCERCSYYKNCLEGGE